MVVRTASGGLINSERRKHPTSSVEAVVLTVVGSAVFCVGLRLNRVFEPDDLMLLRRTRLPGHGWIVNWLALRGR